MSIKDLAYRMAHNYPGGVPALAARMDISKHVLQNKVNPNCETHKLSAEDLDRMTDFSDSDETAKYFAGKRSLALFPVPNFDYASDQELLDLFLKLEKEKGEWCKTVQQSLADGGIDPGEFNRIHAEFMDYSAASAEVMARLKSMVRERRKVAR